MSSSIKALCLAIGLLALPAQAYTPPATSQLTLFSGGPPEAPGLNIGGALLLASSATAIGSTTCLNSDGSGGCTALTANGVAGIRITSSGSGAFTLYGIGETCVTNAIRPMTLINATINTMTLANDSTGEPTERHRLLTGTGADVTVGPGRTVALGYDDSLSRWHVIGSIISKVVRVADLTINTTTTETDIDSLTLASYAPQGGARFHILSGGTVGVGTTAHSIRWRGKVAGTTVCDTGTVMLVDTGQLAYSVDATLTVRTAGSSGTVQCDGMFLWDDTMVATTLIPIRGGATVNLTGSPTVSHTIKFGSSSASDSLTATTGVIELLD